MDEFIFFPQYLQVILRPEKTKQGRKGPGPVVSSSNLSLGLLQADGSQSWVWPGAAAPLHHKEPFSQRSQVSEARGCHCQRTTKGTRGRLVGAGETGQPGLPSGKGLALNN